LIKRKKKGVIHTQIIASVLIVILCSGIVLGSVWGPEENSYLTDPLWVYGPQDLESMEEVQEWLNQALIKNAVYLMYSAYPGAADALYVEVNAGHMSLNAPAPTTSNLGMISGESDPYIDYGVRILLSDKYDLRVILVGPVYVDGREFGMFIPYKTIEWTTGITRKSCYNIYGNVREHSDEYPIPSPTPYEPNDPNYPDPTPTPQTPVNPTPTPETPPPDPTPPTVIYVVPTPRMPHIPTYNQPDRFVVVKKSYEYHQMQILSFWYSHSWGEIEYEVVDEPNEPTPIPSHCPTLFPTQPVPVEPTPIPSHCPTFVPDGPTPVEEPTPPPHHPDPPEHPMIPDY